MRTDKTFSNMSKVTEKTNAIIDYLYSNKGLRNNEIVVAASVFFSTHDRKEHSEIFEPVAQYVHELSNLIPQSDIPFVKENSDFIVESAIQRVENSRFSGFGIAVPAEVIDFMISVAGIDKLSKDSKVFIPFSGTGYFAKHINVRCIEEEIYPLAFVLASMRAVISNKGDMVKLNQTPYIHFDESFSAAICFPPFGGPNRDMQSETAFLINSIAYQIQGKTVCLFPQNYTRVAYMETFRHSIWGDRRLSMIVSLPPLFTHTTGVPMALFVYDNEEKSSITMVDAKSFVKKDQKTKRNILQTESLLNAISAKDKTCVVDVMYDGDGSGNNCLQGLLMTPEMYLLGEPQEGYKTVRLDEIAHISVEREHPKYGAYRIGAKDLSDDFLNCEINISNLEPIAESAHSDMRKVVPNSYVLYIMGDKVRIGHVSDVEEDVHLYTSITNIVLTFKSGTNVMEEKYFLKMLLSEYVQKQIYALSCGSVRPIFRQRDLHSILIPFKPSRVEREKELNIAFESELSEYELHLKNALDTYKKNIRARKHAISQNLSSFSALWNTLNKFRINNGDLENTDVVGIINKISVDDAFNTLDHQLKTLLIQAENLADVEYNWGEAEEIEPDMYFHKFSQSHLDTRFKYEQDINLEEYEDYPEDCRARFMFPKKALDRVLENIISNAVSHGFKDKSRKDYKIRFTYEWDPFVKFELYIANNGAPLPEDISTDDVLTYGLSSALNEQYDDGQTSAVHSGIGGAEIDAIMKQFDAKVEVISTPSEEFTVTYKLTIKHEEE